MIDKQVSLNTSDVASCHWPQQMALQADKPYLQTTATPPWASACALCMLGKYKGHSTL